MVGPSPGRKPRAGAGGTSSVWPCPRPDPARPGAAAAQRRLLAAACIACTRCKRPQAPASTRHPAQPCTRLLGSARLRATRHAVMAGCTGRAVGAATCRPVGWLAAAAGSSGWARPASLQQSSPILGRALRALSPRNEGACSARRTRSMAAPPRSCGPPVAFLHSRSSIGNRLQLLSIEHGLRVSCALMGRPSVCRRLAPAPPGPAVRLSSHRAAGSSRVAPWRARQWAATAACRLPPPAGSALQAGERAWHGSRC